MGQCLSLSIEYDGNPVNGFIPMGDTTSGTPGHEKDLFKVGLIKQYWDEVVFLNPEHREYHKEYNGKWSIIPNLTQKLDYKNRINRINKLRC